MSIICTDARKLQRKKRDLHVTFLVHLRRSVRL
jgi:hypothetical protein